jgi:hypothetical protein
MYITIVCTFSTKQIKHAHTLTLSTSEHVLNFFMYIKNIKCYVYKHDTYIKKYIITTNTP